jgi:hypothetical protein
MAKVGRPAIYDVSILGLMDKQLKVICFIMSSVEAPVSILGLMDKQLKELRIVPP